MYAGQIYAGTLDDLVPLVQGGYADWHEPPTPPKPERAAAPRGRRVR